ncbi:MAG: sulfatase-like hydrolase/transferase [Planctomycetes bacterium]|nr:sulfatase-like hydrolase/transferase [Planctomycetota bacterium]
MSTSEPGSAATHVSPVERAASTPSNRRRDGRFDWILHVYAAFAMAVAAPMYGRLQQRTMFLISFDSMAIVAFAIVFSVIVPVVLLFVVWALRRCHRRIGGLATQTVIGVCCGLFLATVFCRTLSGGGLGWLTLLGCLAGVFAGGRCYAAWSGMRSLLNVVAAASVLIPVTLLSAYFRDSIRPTVQRDQSAGNPIPIVMVVFDCCCGVSLLDQNRQIDQDRFPQFARLAAMSNWYRNCTTIHPRTSAAVPAILTGNFPDGARAPTLEQYPQNLFTLVNATREYQLTAFEPLTRLCPEDNTQARPASNPWSELILLATTMGSVYLKDIVPADVPVETPRIPRVWFGLQHTKGQDPNQRRGLIKYSWDVHRHAQFEHFLRCIQATDEPTCWFGHFALPHFPWDYLPSGNAYRNDDGIRPEWGTSGIVMEDWADDELVVLQAHQRYLLQLGFTDTLVGKLIDRLQSTGLLDRCLLVVVADHGVSFRAGMSRRSPSEKSFADILSVPLFIKLPGQRAGDVIDWNVETIDVLPTILDVVKLSPARSVQGQSIVSAGFQERPRKRFTNDVQVFEFDGAFEARHELLIEQIARFGIGKDPLRILKIGPNPELLGRPLNQLTIKEDSLIQILPVNFQQDCTYTPGSLVPCHLEASFHLGNRPRDEIAFAVAINDTVWGTTKPFRVPYLQDFWRVMLPEFAFQAGSNRIRIFEIKTAGNVISLAECPIGPQTSGPDLQNQ